MKTVFLIVLLSFLGAITGSLIGVLGRPTHKFMYRMIAFAAGVMLAISFLELIPEGIRISSVLYCAIGFIIGAFFMYIADKFIPHVHAEARTQEPGKKLKRTAAYITLGMFLHNFPEGMSIAISSFSSLKLSSTIALAIAMHHIPEGICSASTSYFSTKNRLKAFFISTSTVVSVFLGFLVPYYFFQNISAPLLGLLLGATAGLMVYITGDELIPASSYHVTNHTTIFYLIFGALLVILLKMI